ncbi:hypothetical protein HDU96_008469 [Phlyctochytrium bullatum]|nr:hypothetical protein HDU96_008469 [Phlyctochytrium bullatum]
MLENDLDKLPATFPTTPPPSLPSSPSTPDASDRHVRTLRAESIDGRDPADPIDRTEGSYPAPDDDRVDAAEDVTRPTGDAVARVGGAVTLAAGAGAGAGTYPSVASGESTGAVRDPPPADAGPADAGPAGRGRHPMSCGKLLERWWENTMLAPGAAPAAAATPSASSAGDDATDDATDEVEGKRMWPGRGWMCAREARTRPAAAARRMRVSQARASDWLPVRRTQ